MLHYGNEAPDLQGACAAATFDCLYEVIYRASISFMHIVHHECWDPFYACSMQYAMDMVQIVTHVQT